jgi:hypothetical protein
MEGRVWNHRTCTADPIGVVGIFESKLDLELDDLHLVE